MITKGQVRRQFYKGFDFARDGRPRPTPKNTFDSRDTRLKVEAFIAGFDLGSVPRMPKDINRCFEIWSIVWKGWNP